MKSLSFKELDRTVDQINLSAGAIIEDVVFNNNVLLILLKNNHKKISFVIDIRPKPFLLVSEDRAPSLKKQTKPLVLFLKAHFLQSQFLSAHVQKEFGRLVVLKFTDNRSLELHLFSQARNIIARHDKAQISLNKVTTLQPMGEVREDPNPRSPQEIYQEWTELGKKPQKIAEEPERDREKALNKKKQGLVDLDKKKNDLAKSPWPLAAQWMSANRSLEVPAELRELVDEEQTLAWNIERAFTKSKQIKEKIKAIEERVAVLQKEIDHFASQPSSIKQKVAANKTAIDGSKGRTKIISDQIRAFIGKSAEDNLKILRKSKAWHLWLHVKDLPGSHGIIAFDKSVKVPIEVLREVAVWVVEQSLSAKQRESWKGVKCEVIYCECRFVTPIRGDKLGRVTYKNEKVLSVSL